MRGGNFLSSVLLSMHLHSMKIFLLIRIQNKISLTEVEAATRDVGYLKKIVLPLPSFFDLQGGNFLLSYPHPKSILILFTLSLSVHVKWSDDNEPDIKLNCLL